MNIRDKNLDKILDFIADSNGVRFMEIVKGTSLSAPTVDKGIKELVLLKEIFQGVTKEKKKDGKIGEYKGYYYNL